MLESSKLPGYTAIDILNLIAPTAAMHATIIDTLGIPNTAICCLMNLGQCFLSLDHQENFCLWTRLVELSGYALSKMDLRNWLDRV